MTEPRLTVHLLPDWDPRRVWEALLEFEARLDRMIEEKTDSAASPGKTNRGVLDALSSAEAETEATEGH